VSELILMLCVLKVLWPMFMRLGVMRSIDWSRLPSYCLAFCLVTCLLSFSQKTSAQPNDLGARLSKIRADVVATERVIDDLKNEFNRLRKEEKKLESEIERLSNQEQDMLQKSNEVLRRKEKLLVDLKAGEQRVSEQQSLIRDRLRVLYMNASVTARTIVLGAVDNGQVERMAVYAGAMNRFDQSRFKEISRAVEELLAVRAGLDKALAEGKSLQDGLQVKRTELESQRAKQRNVLTQIQSRQQAAKKSLVSLSKEADKLEELMRVIMSSEGESNEDEARDEVTPVATREITPTLPMESDQKSDRVLDSKPTSNEVIRSPAQVMHPGGLFAQTAKVSYPVTGEIVQRFGKNKVTSFADMVFSKGVEYKTPEGSQVKAVLGGRVAFTGVMPGYDTVVIIDHGERSYSLYGRLGKSLVKQGDLVGRRDVIGVTSAADSKGRNFYFETRKNGAPVDPGTVLSKAS